MQRVSTLDVNALLADHFDSYAHDILKKVLDPIKRTDSVYRFKQSILSILESWSDSDEVILFLAAEEEKRHPESDENTAREDVLRKINFIIDTYSSIQNTIAMIENRHAEYTRAAIDRMRYMVSYDRGSRGLLTKILMHSSDDNMATILSDSISVLSSRFLISESLYDRIRRTELDEGAIDRIERVELPDGEAEMLMNEFESAYSNDRIDDFIMSKLDGRDEVHTEELCIEDENTSLLFVLALMRSSELLSPFMMEMGDEEVICGDYILPEAVFRRNSHD